MKLMSVLISMSLSYSFVVQANPLTQRVGEVCQSLLEKVKKTKPSRVSPSAGWVGNHGSEAPVSMPETGSLAETIVRKGLADESRVISEDKTRGPITYGDELEQALAIAKLLEKVVLEERVGVLLPASGGNALIFLATHLAGKVPAYVNVTTPPAAIVAGLDSIGVKKILTVKAVVEGLGAKYDLSKYADRFIFLDDHVRSIKAGVVAARIQKRLARKSYENTLIQRSRRTKTAVILFTSGSSGVPKAVPLSHKNVLTNIQDGLEVFRLNDNDRIMLFLPPFHSFGMMLMAMAQAVSIPAIYHPVPTDYKAIADQAEIYKPTLMGSTPSFLESIAVMMGERTLPSLRMIFVGAEALKPHQAKLFKIKFPNAVVLEGYGMTELSPTFAINRSEDPQLGTVGRPLPSFVRGHGYKLVNPETFQPVALGEMGLLICKGDSVFEGYLNSEQNPFVELNGEKWFVTGDLFVQKEIDGPLSFKGRQTRMKKRKGEILQIDAIEAALAEFLDPKRPLVNGSKMEGPLAVVEMADDNEPAVLFTPVNLGPNAVDLANAELKRRGFAGSHMISEVRVVHEPIALLGSGKIDYKPYQAAVKNRAQSSK